MFTDHLTYSDQQITYFFLFLSFRLMFNDEGYIVIWDQFIDRRPAVVLMGVSSSRCSSGGGVVLGGEGVAGLFLLMNEYGVSLSSMFDEPSK